MTELSSGLPRARGGDPEIFIDSRETQYHSAHITILCHSWTFAVRQIRGWPYRSRTGPFTLPERQGFESRKEVRAMEKQSLPNKAKARMLRTLAKLRGSGLLPCHRHDSGASRTAQRPTDGRSQPLNRATNSHCPFHAPTDKKARSLKFRKRGASSLESCGGSCLPIGLASFVVGLLARPSPAPHRLRARIPSSFDESATQNDFNLSVDRPKIVGSPLGYRLVDCRIQPEKELFTLGFSPFAGSRTLALLGRHSASGLLVPPGH